MTRLGLVRSGGFAGLRREVTVDTEKHPDGAWFDAELSSLDLASFGAPLSDPAATAPSSSGPDRFQYALSVETDGTSQLLRFGEEVPALLSPLVDRMLGRSGGPSDGRSIRDGRADPG